MKAPRSYILIRGLCNDAASSSGNWLIAWNDRMINELERIWQKAIQM